jgi:hypothetical protein
MNSVLKHGAKGDGKTDDTEAFRRALMQEGEVHVPDGMYVITGDLPVSRLCRGISSDMCGGIILARHPEWGMDFPRYFKSAIIVPNTTSYRLKCAAIEWAIRVCAKMGRVPAWLHQWRDQQLPVTKFRISNLSVRGRQAKPYPGISVGGLFLKSYDPRLSLDIIGNHFICDGYVPPKSFVTDVLFAVNEELTEHSLVENKKPEMVLVPAEPTDEMLEAMTDALGDKIFESGTEYYFRDQADALWFGRQVWAAMVRQGGNAND